MVVDNADAHPGTNFAPGTRLAVAFANHVLQNGLAQGGNGSGGGLGTGDTIAGFQTGQDKVDVTDGPVGTAQDFESTSTTSTAFAQIQALAQSLLSGMVSYALVADGADGYLFTNGGDGHSTRTDAVELAGAGSVASLAYADIAHHPVA